VVSPIAAFIEAMLQVESPDSLYPLAATSNALMATAEKPGPLLLVHAILTLAANRIEGEPMDVSDWAAVRQLLSRLADYLRVPDPETLDAVGLCWRDWTAPTPLQ
jgi:hypothetical protein